MPTPEDPRGSEVAADARRPEKTPRYYGQAWGAADRPPDQAQAARQNVPGADPVAEEDEEERKEQRELQRERDGGHTRPPESVGR
jgi:hypothetical protein